MKLGGGGGRLLMFSEGGERIKEEAIHEEPTREKGS